MAEPASIHRPLRPVGTRLPPRPFLLPEGVRALSSGACHEAPDFRADWSRNCCSFPNRDRCERHVGRKECAGSAAQDELASAIALWRDVRSPLVKPNSLAQFPIPVLSRFLASLRCAHHVGFHPAKLTSLSNCPIARLLRFVPWGASLPSIDRP